MADVSEIPDTALTDAIDTLSGIAQPSAGVLSIDQANALGVLIRYASTARSDGTARPRSEIEAEYWKATAHLNAKSTAPDALRAALQAVRKFITGKHSDDVTRADAQAIVDKIDAALATPAPSEAQVEADAITELYRRYQTNGEFTVSSDVVGCGRVTIAVGPRALLNEDTNG